MVAIFIKEPAGFIVWSEHTVSCSICLLPPSAAGSVDVGMVGHIIVHTESALRVAHTFPTRVEGTLAVAQRNSRGALVVHHVEAPSQQEQAHNDSRLAPDKKLPPANPVHQEEANDGEQEVPECRDGGEPDGISVREPGHLYDGGTVVPVRVGRRGTEAHYGPNRVGDTKMVYIGTMDSHNDNTRAL